MAYRVRLYREVRKTLAVLPEKVRRQIVRRAEALAEDPRPHGCRLLKGTTPDLFRIRSGDYRIIYQVREKVLLVLVVKVGHRKDMYRGL